MFGGVGLAHYPFRVRADEEAAVALAGLLSGAGFGWPHVPDEVLVDLCRHARLVETAPKRALFRRGDPCAGLFFVRRGEYQVSMISSEGREQIVFLADAGKLVSEGLTAEGETCRVSCFARSEASAWQLSYADLRAAGLRCGAVALALVQTLGYRQGRMLELIYDLSLRSVEQRLAAFLVFLARRDVQRAEGGNGAEGGKQRVELIRDLDVQTVAELLGTTRAEVTRAQAKLRRAGLVEITRQRVTILDLESLDALA